MPTRSTEGRAGSITIASKSSPKPNPELARQPCDSCSRLYSLDRFHVAVKMDTQPVPGYVLSTGKGELKLKAATGDSGSNGCQRAMRLNAGVMTTSLSMPQHDHGRICVLSTRARFIAGLKLDRARRWLGYRFPICSRQARSRGHARERRYRCGGGTWIEAGTGKSSAAGPHR